MTLGGIPYTVVTLAVIGMLLIVFGMLMSEVQKVDNELMKDTSLPYSQERANTMQFISACFECMGVVTVLTCGIFLIMNGTQNQSGEI